MVFNVMFLLKKVLAFDNKCVKIIVRTKNIVFCSCGMLAHTLLSAAVTKNIIRIRIR